MRSLFLIAAFAVTIAAFPGSEVQAEQKLFTVELAPRETRCVTEDEKFGLINVSMLTALHFFLLRISLTIL